MIVMGSATAELHGRKTADRLVYWGFLPMLVSAGLIQLVLALPTTADQRLLLCGLCVFANFVQNLQETVSICGARLVFQPPSRTGG